MPSNIRISADSTCDLSPELAARFNIEIVPLYVTLGGEALRDGVEVHQDDVFAYYESTGKLAHSSAVSAADYTEVFTRLRADGAEVVHISLSDALSVTHQNALTAAEEVGGVSVIDSKSLSTGIGQLAIMAAELAEAGMSRAEIADALTEARERLDVSFVIDTLEYLYKGGRCSALAMFGANLLKLKVNIQLHDGQMGVGRKYRGNIDKIYARYVTDTLAAAPSLDTRRIFITHSGVSQEAVEACRKAILEFAPFEEVLDTRAGCTVCAHCGPGCLGILFFHGRQ